MKGFGGGGGPACRAFRHPQAAAAIATAATRRVPPRCQLSAPAFLRPGLPVSLPPPRRCSDPPQVQLAAAELLTAAAAAAALSHKSVLMQAS